MGKNKKPMLTVLVEEEKLQQFRDYASTQGMSMGAVVNQLIDGLLEGKSSPESIETSIDNTIPIENIVNTSIENNNKSIEVLIATSIDNCHKSIEEKIAESIEGNNKAIEEKIAESIEDYDKSIDSSPPTLTLLDVDRLIGSAISDLKNIIKHQGAEIARINLIIEKSSSSNSPEPIPEPVTVIPSYPLRWNEFCELIGEPLPSKHVKDNADKLIELAKSKGFGDWRYDSNKKKFIQSVAIV
jgi:hypothetical protein